MLRLSTAVFVLGALAAQQGPPAAGSLETRIETKHLAIVTSSSAPAASSGKRVSLLVDVTPKPKVHVYAPGQDGYITIALTLDRNPAFTAAKVKYPASEKIFMESLKETQIVYAKPFRIAQDITFRAGAVQGSAPVTVKGTLRYQACDDKICYLPADVPVQWTIR